MTDDKDELIRQLTMRLRETVDENDQLRAELARMTEGASAHDTLSELHRNRDLPPAIRAKAAIGCLGVESAPLKPVEPPLDLVAEPYVPLAELVAKRRAHVARLASETKDIEVLPNGTVRVLPRPGSNGSDQT